MRAIRDRLTYANVAATLALVVAAGGGTAYAANTVFSADIVNGEVKSADVGSDEVRSVDVRDDSLAGGGLTGADIRESTLAAVQGRGRLLSDRVVVQATVPVSGETLFVIPGLGVLEAFCFDTAAVVQFSNTTNQTIDVWVEDPREEEGFFARPFVPNETWPVANSDVIPGAAFSVGRGEDPGPRRIATIHAFAFQGEDGAPCRAQAQGTLWTSE
jgi:hypothetical protein